LTVDVVDVPEPMGVVKAGLEPPDVDGAAGFAVASTLARTDGNGTPWYGTHRDVLVFQQATAAPIPETPTVLQVTTHSSRT
jgi:hypothetical protein